MAFRIILAICIFVGQTSRGQTKSLPLEVPLISTNGNVGKVIFRETMGGRLNIDVQVQSLIRGEHGIHIHQNSVCDAPDFRTAGMHFNPDLKKHGWNNPRGHHAGDLPENILVDADGNGHLNVTVSTLNLTPGSPYSVLNRSIVVHEHADDMKSDPSGDSGNRIACAVIEQSR